LESVDSGSFFAIFAAAAVAALLVAALGRRAFLPVVVVELLLGILIGPEGLGLAKPGEFIDFFAIGGLGMLFFFAGYEIDFERVRGKPLQLGLTGWLTSVVLAYLLAGALQLSGVVVSGLYTGTALATTALGALIPILDDSGDLRSRFGTWVLAAGAIGEIGPILILTVGLSATAPLEQIGLLAAFAAGAVLLGTAAAKGTGRAWGAFERGIATTGQAPVRLVVLLVFALIAIAGNLGLEALLGGFVAGIVVRLALRGRDVEEFESKLVAIGYGFFIPFFFVVSGMNLDIDTLVGSPAALAKLPLFLVLFLVVRGLPALLLYRGVLGIRDRAALAFLSATQLPLVVAITTVAVEHGSMRPSTAAALVGAALLSTALFPLVAMGLRRSVPSTA